jgi:hypothetical protein
LIAILVATLLARAGFLLFFADTLSLQTSGYDDYAVHLLEGRGYTRFDDRSGDSDLPPLYPFFLAGTYALSQTKRPDCCPPRFTAAIRTCFFRI